MGGLWFRRPQNPAGARSPDRHLRKFVEIALCVPLLASCGAPRADVIKANPSKSETATLDMNYQEAYRNLSNTARACLDHPVGLIGGSNYQVQADLYSELGRGDVALYFNGPFSGRHAYVSAEVIKTGEKQTQVSVYSATSPWDYAVPRWISWAQGNQDCSGNVSPEPSDQPQSPALGVRTPGGRL